MKKVIYALILPLVVVSGVVLANQKLKPENSKNLTAQPLTAAEKKSAMQQWEASPDGIKYKQWEASPIGQKVLAIADKISKPLRDSANIEAVITSLSLPPGSRLGYGVMARIDGEDYILTFGGLKPSEYQQLPSLKVNDKIIIRGRGVSHAPKYSYAIIWGEYAERYGKMIFKSPPRKGGC